MFRVGMDEVMGLLLALACVQGLLAAEGIISPFSALFSLGDSTIDVGTNNHLLTVIKANFDPYGRDLSGELPKGRFSNGLISIDYLAADLGLPYPIPYIDRAGKDEQQLRSISFASAGAGWINLTAVLYNVYSFSDQIQQLRDYKEELGANFGQAKAEDIITNALFIISTGSNDYLLDYYLNLILQQQYTIPEFQQLTRETAMTYMEHWGTKPGQELSISLPCTLPSSETEQSSFCRFDPDTDLYQIGARNVAIFDLPPIGCTPAAINVYGFKGIGDDGCVQVLNENAISANRGVEELVIPELRRRYPDAKFVFLDTFGYAKDVLSHPQTYGYKQVHRSCCGTGTVEVSILCNPLDYGTCSNADEFFFFDSFHPGSKLYKGFKDFILPQLRKSFGF